VAVGAARTPLPVGTAHDVAAGASGRPTRLGHAVGFVRLPANRIRPRRRLARALRRLAAHYRRRQHVGAGALLGPSEQFLPPTPSPPRKARAAAQGDTRSSLTGTVSRASSPTAPDSSIVGSDRSGS